MSAAAPPRTACQHLGVVGLGLIGGSVALAAKRIGWKVSAYNRNAEIAAAAAHARAINCSVENIAQLGQCDMIFLAVPMTVYDSALGQLAPTLATHSVITDVGSTKQCAIDSARRCLTPQQQSRFVPGHPIAGKEKSGWGEASADLFADHLVILCTENRDEEACQKVGNFWRQIGARTQTLSAAAHDQYLALVSHLPHLLAYTLVNTIDNHENSGQLLQLAAGGFRDFTRIAASHPEMWRDICLTNGKNILQMIELYQRELSRFAECIKNQDGNALITRMSAARALRQEWLETLEQ